MSGIYESIEDDGLKEKKKISHENPCSYCGFPVERTDGHDEQCPNFHETLEEETPISDEEFLKESEARSKQYQLDESDE